MSAKPSLMTGGVTKGWKDWCVIGWRERVRRPPSTIASEKKEGREDTAW